MVVRIAVMRPTYRERSRFQEELHFHAGQFDDVVVAQRVMQVGGGAVGLLLFGFLALFWGRELKKSMKNKATKTLPSDLPGDVTV